MTSQSLPSTYKAARAAPDKDHDPYLDELPLKMPGTNQVLVKIAFSPLNPTDLLSGKRQAPGYSQTGELIGSEGSGIIVAVGNDLKVNHKVGDRVHVIGPGCLSLGDGCWAQYVLKDSESCSPIMEGLSLEEAASHWINPGTAYLMRKIVKEGNHKAAIHTAGTSALGKMLIRYFKKEGIKLINIVRREEAIEELKREEGAEYVLNSKDPKFFENLKEICEKLGATCAFDAIGGDFTNRLLGCMPWKSTAYVYGVLSGGTGVDHLDWVVLIQKKCVTSLLIYNLTNEMREQGKLQEFFKGIHSLLPTIFKTNILKVFSLDQIHGAIEPYKDNSSKGKILIKPN